MAESDKISPKVCILRYPGAMASAVFGLQDMLAHVSRLSRRGLDPVVVSRPGEIEGRDWAALMLPPSLSEIRPKDAPWVTRMVADSAAGGAIICSACTGLVWVAAAGVDRGRRVTTHWQLHQPIKRDWPALNLDTGQILIEHSDLITAGGVMSWIDLALVLAERLSGRAAALALARHFVVDPGRRDQRRYSRFLPELRHGDTAVLSAQQRLETALAEPLGVTQLAKGVALTTRTFLRRFRRATGLTPKQYQQNLRVEQARHLLLETDRAVAEVAHAVGYLDVTAFMRVFKAIAGQSPAAFRQSFR